MGSGFSGGGFGATSSDDGDSGDSDDDDSQGEVRRYWSRGYRYPSYRYGYRPAYRYGYGRGYWSQRYPYAGRGYSYYRGRHWPYGRYAGAYRSSPYQYRRWPWLYRRSYGFGAASSAGGPSGSPWILMVQSCLRRLFGAGATPVDGALGPQTRRAVRAFQRRAGLPPSGDLNSATVQALQRACMGGGAAAPASARPLALPPPPEPAAAAPPPEDAAGAPPPEPPPPEPAPGGEPPPDAAAAPPDGAPPADGDAPPADAQGEITLGRREGEVAQEFLVDGPMQVSVERHDPVPLDRDPQFSFMPDAPGLYVIYVNNTPWYVGIAEGSLRNRFLQRRKVLSDLQISPSALANRSVGWYLLRYSSAPKGAIQRRPQNNPAASFHPVFGKYAALRILEQLYIKRLHNPSGNKTTEGVQFSPRGSLVVTENGAKISEHQPNSRV